MEDVEPRVREEVEEVVGVRDPSRDGANIICSPRSAGGVHRHHTTGVASQVGTAIGCEARCVDPVRGLLLRCVHTDLDAEPYPFELGSKGV